jgi:hypothetical protein
MCDEHDIQTTPSQEFLDGISAKLNKLSLSLNKKIAELSQLGDSPAAIEARMRFCLGYTEAAAIQNECGEVCQQFIDDFSYTI